MPKNEQKKNIGILIVKRKMYIAHKKIEKKKNGKGKKENYLLVD